MPPRLKIEVGEAFKALDNELEPIYAKPTHANVLIEIAKRLQRLQTRRKSLRASLKTIDADICTAKKELKAIAQAMAKGDA